jgi:hypothetical protein
LKPLRVDTTGLRIAEERCTAIAGRVAAPSASGGQASTAAANAVSAAIGAAGSTLSARISIRAANAGGAATAYDKQDTRSAEKVYEEMV